MCFFFEFQIQKKRENKGFRMKGFKLDRYYYISSQNSHFLGRIHLHEHHSVYYSFFNIKRISVKRKNINTILNDTMKSKRGKNYTILPNDTTTSKREKNQFQEF